MYDICQQSGLLTDRDVGDYCQDTVLALDPVEMKQVLFSAQYFVLLVRAYAQLFKTPERIRRALVRVVDTILISKIAALLVFPLLTKLISIVFKHELLFKYARRAKRRLIDT